MKVLAVLCSDIHLGHAKPKCRKGDWYEVMHFYIEQINQIAEKSGDVRVVCAGDLLHHYLQPPELINFLIPRLDGWVCVRGQHDLPFHRNEDVEKSAYWTLASADVIFDLGGMTQLRAQPTLFMHPFHWGDELKENPAKEETKAVHLAVCHRYVWLPGYEHPKAEEEDCLADSNWCSKYGYDAMLFGDNHKGFLAPGGILNNGCVIRRTVKEIDYQPHVGLLWEDGHITQVKLDTSIDEFVEEPEAIVEYEADEFVSGLESVSSDSIDFKQALREGSKGLDEMGQMIIERAIEKCDSQKQ